MGLAGGGVAVGRGIGDWAMVGNIGVTPVVGLPAGDIGVWVTVARGAVDDGFRNALLTPILLPATSVPSAKHVKIPATSAPIASSATKGNHRLCLIGLLSSEPLYGQPYGWRFHDVTLAQQHKNLV